MTPYRDFVAVVLAVGPTWSPDVCAHLDLATLEVRPGSFVDPALQQAHSDLLYAVRTRTGEEGFLFVLFEHQSSHDRAMAFRILKYVVRIWERFLNRSSGGRSCRS